MAAVDVGLYAGAWYQPHHDRGLGPALCRHPDCHVCRNLEMARRPRTPSEDAPPSWSPEVEEDTLISKTRPVTSSHGRPGHRWRQDFSLARSRTFSRSRMPVNTSVVPFAAMTGTDRHIIP